MTVRRHDAPLKYGRCPICGEHYSCRVTHLVYQHGWMARGTVTYPDGTKVEGTMTRQSVTPTPTER